MCVFLVQCSAAHCDLLSSPTRRSSDLDRTDLCVARLHREDQLRGGTRHHRVGFTGRRTAAEAHTVVSGAASRSEEHTSELQSHSDLVCRLLLEKKKKNTQKQRRED